MFWVKPNMSRLNLIIAKDDNFEIPQSIFSCNTTFYNSVMVSCKSQVYSHLMFHKARRAEKETMSRAGWWRSLPLLGSIVLQLSLLQLTTSTEPPGSFSCLFKQVPLVQQLRTQTDLPPATVTEAKHPSTPGQETFVMEVEPFSQAVSVVPAPLPQT